MTPCAAALGGRTGSVTSLVWPGLVWLAWLVVYMYVSRGVCLFSSLSVSFLSPSSTEDGDETLALHLWSSSFPFLFYPPSVLFVLASTLAIAFE